MHILIRKLANHLHLLSNIINQPISEFVFCKRAATDVLRTTSIPLNSAPLKSVTATDRIETMNPRGLSDGKACFTCLN